MNLQWLFLLTGMFLLCLIETTNSIRCTDTKKCLCIPHPIRQSYEFQCPPNPTDTGGVVVHVLERESRIKIDCVDNPSFKPNMFAKIDAGDIAWVDIKDCPLPRNRSFEEIIQKLTSSKPLVLGFERMEITEESLNKDYFKGFDNLLGLSLRSNKLEELDEDLFANTPDLKMINLQENGIQLNPNIFNFTPDLSELDISVNGIQSLPVGVFRNLKYLQLLHMWNNRLKYLDETTFSGLRSLGVLELSMNKIETIDVRTFANMTQLTNLSLSENPIRQIPADLFANNKLLEEVLLESNPHMTLSDYALANLPNLRQVVLSRSNLSRIPANLFNGSTSLRVLRLDQNRLKTLSDDFFKGLGNLTVLNLGKNLFEAIPNFHGLRRLQKLYMDYNALTRIDKEFEKLTNLVMINLEHNYITQISTYAFPASLRRLSLAHNRFNFGEQNPFMNCVKLELIDLSHNLITSMRYELALYAVKLKELILNNNLIKEVDFLDFQTVAGATIFLRNNQITNIDFRSAKTLVGQFKADPKESTEVYLKGNPIQCDCNVYDLVRYVQGKLNPNLNALITLEHDEIICAHPKKLEKIRVGGLSLEVLVCPSKELENCPGKCSCSFNPHEDKVVYDCALKNMTHTPELKPAKTKRSLSQEQILGQSKKTSGEPSQERDNVTKLYLPPENKPLEYGLGYHLH